MALTGIRELVRNKFAPIHLFPGDTISLIYQDDDGSQRVVASHVATTMRVFDEGMIFDAEPGVFGEGAALGGVFIERTSHDS